MGFLPVSLVDEVVVRLGLDAAPNGSFAQLELLAAVVHSRLGYDSTGKQLWLVSGASGALPGMDPCAWWSDWLATGSGGTCFNTTVALDALACSLGFVCRMSGWRFLGLDDGVEVHHGANVFTFDEPVTSDRSDVTEFVLESSSYVPVPLQNPREGQVFSDPGRVSTLSCVGGVTQLHTPRATAPGVKIYQLVADELSADDFNGFFMDTLAVHAQAHRRLAFARTRSDGCTVSLAQDRLLVRRGHSVLADTTVDEQYAVRVLHRLGLSRPWLVQLQDAGVFDGFSSPPG